VLIGHAFAQSFSELVHLSRRLMIGDSGNGPRNPAWTVTGTTSRGPRRTLFDYEFPRLRQEVRLSRVGAGRLWIRESNSGNVSVHDPVDKSWKQWKLPGENRTYAVWVDLDDKIWLSEWRANAIVRFGPTNVSKQSRKF